MGAFSLIVKVLTALQTSIYIKCFSIAANRTSTLNIARFDFDATNFHLNWPFCSPELRQTVFKLNIEVLSELRKEKLDDIPYGCLSYKRHCILAWWLFTKIQNQLGYYFVGISILRGRQHGSN